MTSVNMGIKPTALTPRVIIRQTHDHAGAVIKFEPTIDCTAEYSMHLDASSASKDGFRSKGT